MIASPDYPDRAEARAEKAQRVVGRGGPEEVGCVTFDRASASRLPDGRCRWADQSSGHDVLLERVGPPGCPASKGHSHGLEIRPARTHSAKYASGTVLIGAR